MKKVLVGLSGGVDSAVSAYLLKEQGYDVVAGFMINYLADEGEACPTREDIEVAREVAAFLDIPFFTFDYRDEYEEKVLNYMYEGYRKGITPNPDIMCNSEIKFKVFLDEALELGYDMVATGHYARITPPGRRGLGGGVVSEQLDGGVIGAPQDYSLKKGIDPTKDQSYFLAGLNQKQLSKSLFPIGHMQKSEVRELAKKIGLPNADRKDSQGICFVGKVNISDFLEKKIEHKTGLIKDTTGTILGEHKGVFYYTIGQRKGLDLGGQKEPVFIIKKDIINNEIIVGYSNEEALYDDKLIMHHVHFLGQQNYAFPLEAKAKIRYRQDDQDCTVSRQDNGNYLVQFKQKQRAIASGQICAIYQDDILIMSGIIS